MRILAVPVGAALSLLLVGGCGTADDADPAPPVTEPAPTSTTTASSTTTSEAPTTPTSHPPDTVEGQVEAAYLHSWEILLGALREPEMAHLEEAFSARALALKRNELAELVAGGHAVEGSVEHSYNIESVGPDTFSVVDVFRNHLVLVDATTRRPLEADPNNRQGQTFTLQREGDRWVVIEVFNI